MPRVDRVEPETDRRLSDHISIGLLVRAFPPDLVDRVVAETERTEVRHRLLPARMVVYYVLSLALFRQASYEEVMRNLVEGLSWATGWARTWNVPTKAALFKARARLGPEPLQRLFDTVAVPLATTSAPGAFWRGLRLMSLDGTCVDVAGTPANAEAFGSSGSGRAAGRGSGVGAFPQLRLVGLAECGTRALVDVVVGARTVGETTLAPGLFRSLRPGMVLLADRGFCDFKLWNKARDTGAELVWRTRAVHGLAIDKRLPDGSYRSKFYRIVNGKRAGEGVPVRVVAYGLDDRGRPQAKGRYRLVTTLLDPDAAPAHELASVYAKRRELESALDELKTHQGGARVVLRSKLPGGVIQEMYAYLCVHWAIRWLMHTVAEASDLDRPSFVRPLRGVRPPPTRSLNEPS